MADLEKVVKLTQSQYNTLASGGTVGEYTGLDSNYLYLVENMGDIIDITNGITSAMKEYVKANPSTLLSYDEYIYVPYYNMSSSELPSYYSCLDADNTNMKYIEIDWNNLTVDDEHFYNIITAHQSIKTLNTTVSTSQSTSASESIAGSGTINLHKVSKTGSYNDLNDKPTIPTVNNGKLTIQGASTTASEFTANQSGNTTLNFVGSGRTSISASSGTITISSTGDGNDNQTIKGNGTAFGANDAINLVGSGAVTVTADTTNKKITISAPSVTDTNQTVKTSSVTFGSNDAVQITAGSNITVTGDAGAKTITIAGKAGTVTSVATSGTGLSGGTITSSGTITLDSSSAGNAAQNKVVLRNAAGSIQTEKLAVSSGTTTKVNLQYNTTDDCLDFVFN